MGCDIHLHIEIKLEGVWQHYGCPQIPRIYHLFGKMAGVRDHTVDPITEKKGLPPDITLVTHADYFGSTDPKAKETRDNWHSESWLNKSEIEQLSKWLDEEMGGIQYERDLEHNILHSYLFGNAFWGDSEFKPRGIVEDVRFVFWFDN